MSLKIPVMICLAFALSANKAGANDERYREFDAPRLQHGRDIWLGTFEGCHGWGIAGVPITMNYPEWRARIDKERAVLYRHAINGFFGPDDTMMTERGGNPDLSDADVTAAVDYMIELAKSHKP